jgi:hypothetical protein
MESDFMVFPPEKGMSRGTVCSHSEEEASGVSPGRDDQNRFCEEILTGKAGGDPHGLIRIPVFGRGGLAAKARIANRGHDANLSLRNEEKNEGSQQNLLAISLS